MSKYTESHMVLGLCLLDLCMTYLRCSQDFILKEPLSTVFMVLGNVLVSINKSLATGSVDVQMGNNITRKTRSLWSQVIKNGHLVQIELI